MDEVQLVLTALGAGAAAAGAGTVQGLTESTRAAVAEALAALRKRLGRVLRILS
jgi:isopentenyl diphosphate isomerase/L-lactate dehydrogenase-like FMN-dependent dehydrogenase